MGRAKREHTRRHTGGSRDGDGILDLGNPHSVLAALETRPADVLEVSLPPGGAGPAWQDVAERAGDHGIAVLGGPAGGRQGARKPRDASGDASGGRHGGARARLRPRAPCDLEALFRRDDKRSGLWLALDRIQDSRNLGAVFRSASFFGVRGVVLTRDQSAPLSGVAYDTASGGLEHVPFALPTNLGRALDTARDAGLWILGAAEDAATDVADVDRERPWLLVVGNEEHGLRRLTRERCDELCRITSRGAVGSLNVSVAAAVLIANLTQR